MADMNELGKWAREHGKLLIFEEGPGGAPLELDMRTITPISELILVMLAFAAQMESLAIQERVKGAQAALRSQGRYAGGLPPYGYRKVKNADGPGWKLEQDPTSVKVLAEIIRDVLSGKSLTDVAMRLNDANIPVPRDHAALQAGRKTGGVRRGTRHARFRWTAGTMSKVLRSRALLGYKTHHGAPVRDGDGAPVLITDAPILEREQFDALQDYLATLTPQKGRTRRDTKALLLGVATCAGCGGNMYLSQRAGGADYNCRATARGERCQAPAGIRADWLEAFAVAEFMKVLGERQVTRVVTHRGYDPTPELREVEAELRALYADKDTRKSRTGRMIWQEEVDALERRAEALESTPRTEARTEIIPTGETYAAFWARHDTTGRRRLLVDAGVRITVAKGRTGGDSSRLEGPDVSRLAFAVGEHNDPAAEALDAILREETED